MDDIDKRIDTISSEEEAHAIAQELKERELHIASAIAATKHGKSWQGTRVIDIGCAGGTFIRYAQDELKTAECWGCDHHPQSLADAAKRLSADEMKKILLMPMSEISAKHPELKGTFDIVRIVSVTPYATPYEMRHMLGIAHWLMKQDGMLLLDLPFTINVVGAFSANENDISLVSKLHQDIKSATRTTVDMPYRAKVSRLRENFCNAYSTLADLHFNKIGKDEDHGLDMLVATQPRAVIPKVGDLKFNPSTMELTLGQKAKALQAENAKPKPTASPHVPAWRTALKESGTIGSVATDLSGFGFKK